MKDVFGRLIRQDVFLFSCVASRSQVVGCSGAKVRPGRDV